MKINVYNIERECTIINAPKGVFCTDVEGLYWFPMYFVIAPSVTKDELACGDVLVCPISGFNDDGTESLTTSPFWDCLTSVIFEELIVGHCQVFPTESVEEYAKEVLDVFTYRGVYINPTLRRKLKSKDYLSSLQKEVQQP